MNPEAATPGADLVAATEVGLVLGAGGAAAQAWHCGVVHALQTVTGWDARTSALIVGTSAGAITGLTLRAGVPPADLHARHSGGAVSDEGQAIFDRIVTPYSEHEGERSDLGDWAPQSPKLTLRALWPPWKASPVSAAVGMLPEGTRSTPALEQRLLEMHPAAWPSLPIWVTTVRLGDGRRIVLGRDDVDTTAARAVRASCAVPYRYQPVRIGDHRYVDGGVHSGTNADLAGPPCFDAVVVSSVMTGDAGWGAVKDGLQSGWATLGDAVTREPDRARGATTDHAHGDTTGNADRQDRDGAAGSLLCDERWGRAWSQAWSEGRAIRAARRQWMSTKLNDEAAGLRAQGIPTLVVDPDAEFSQWLDTEAARRGASDPEVHSRIVTEGFEAALRAVAAKRSRRVRGILTRAAG